ncbi:STAS domain-containing protein [Priestia abyssalis]|uniref:STAS domain-containing protein n=1 Tax=Priestia abyssalis TaxID=1221450 RepID=UPI00099565CA|nr:STAS domain-containing protein [Priestia abyssalis]
MSVNEDLNNKPAINVSGIRFKWDMENGVFDFEGDDAVLFWISSAMKTFFDTIEEVSGDDAAGVVLETTGFRQGSVVSEFFSNSHLSVQEIADLIPIIYASAGWGKIRFQEICEENKTAVVYLQDSWEYKINKAQGKKTHGSFLPGHFAGILTGVFGTNVWYEVKKSQIEGDEYCEYHYFPSTITVTNNIHDLARRKESAEIQKLESLVAERTKELRDLVKEISSPIIPVLEEIVVVPLVGKYDETRSEELIEKTLNNLPVYKARYLLLDLTALDIHISNYTITFIEKLGSAASLIGTETILVGISPELGTAISESELNFSKFNCFQTLQHGIYFALAQRGRKIVG